MCIGIGRPTEDVADRIASITGGGAGPTQPIADPRGSDAPSINGEAPPNLDPPITPSFEPTIPPANDNYGSSAPEPEPAPLTAPPAPALSPAPAYESPDPTETAAQRLKRLRALRLGIASTIKTSAQGLTSSPLVSTPSASAGGLKGKLGQ